MRDIASSEDLLLQYLRILANAGKSWVTLKLSTA